jgi:DNA-binding GntR family transcriptional regulator
MGTTTERRNLVERAAIVRGIVNAVLQNPSVTLTTETLEEWVNVPSDAARRILARLASSGIVREIKKGEFVRAPGMGAAPLWS